MADTAYEIEAGVPLPDLKRNNPSSMEFALRTLSGSPAGSSVLLRDTTINKMGPNCRSALGKGLKAAGLTARTVEGGVRVWKI